MQSVLGLFAAVFVILFCRSAYVAFEEQAKETVEGWPTTKRHKEAYIEMVIYITIASCLTLLIWWL